MQLFFSSCANTKGLEMNYSPDKRFFYSNAEYINYTVAGSGKTTLVMLHGFGASLQNGSDISQLLINEGIKLVLIDLKEKRGIFRSNRTGFPLNRTLIPE